MDVGVNAWIAAFFFDATIISGDLNGRVNLETKAWVSNATASGGKYTFSVFENRPPNNPRVAFTNVRILETNVAGEKYGAGIRTRRGDDEMQIFISNVYIEPNHPPFVDYKTSNYDAITINGGTGLFAEDLTILNWNNDAAIDTKADVSQFVDLEISGPGNRSLRLWGLGPHFIVDSTLDNPGGVGRGELLWIKDAERTTVYVYNSTFNGSPRIPTEKIGWDIGSTPNIVYLDEDPRLTGLMHPMFTAGRPASELR